MKKKKKITKFHVSHEIAECQMSVHYMGQVYSIFMKCYYMKVKESETRWRCTIFGVLCNNYIKILSFNSKKIFRKLVQMIKTMTSKVIQLDLKTDHSTRKKDFLKQIVKISRSNNHHLRKSKTYIQTFL